MSFSSHCSTVPLDVPIVNIDINGLVPGSMLMTPAVSFESTNSVPVDVGGRASRWSWRSFLHVSFVYSSCYLSVCVTRLPPYLLCYCS